MNIDVLDPTSSCKSFNRVVNLVVPRYVKRRNRLIHHNQRRPQDRRSPRNADSLTLTTRKRMWYLKARPDPFELAQAFNHLSSLSPRLDTPWMTKGSSTICRTVICGFSDEYGS